MSQFHEVLRPVETAELAALERLAAPYRSPVEKPVEKQSPEEHQESSSTDIKATRAARKAALAVALGRIEVALMAVSTKQEHREEPNREARLEALAAALGFLLCEELGLTWTLVGDQHGSTEAALRLPKEGDSGADHAPVLFFPRRILDRQLSLDTPMKAQGLLDSTRAYVALLRRYFPAVAGL